MLSDEHGQHGMNGINGVLFNIISLTRSSKPLITMVLCYSAALSPLGHTTCGIDPPLYSIHPPLIPYEGGVMPHMCASKHLYRKAYM